MPRYEIVVKGRVQGVGFRAFTERLADTLGVKGYVRNLSDGTVEVVAEASEDALKEFCEKLKSGPTMSHVDDLEISESQESDKFSNFSVKF